MWSDNQRLERHEVESWIAAQYPFPYFRAKVTEKEEPQHSRIRVTMSVVGPNDEPVVINGKQVYYHSLRAMPGMVQFAEDWTA